MRIVTSLIGVFALLGAAIVAAEDGAVVEESFAACLAEKQPALISEILDAKSQESFEGAMKTALDVCPTQSEKLSMGRLFKALASANKTADAEGAE